MTKPAPFAGTGRLERFAIGGYVGPHHMDTSDTSRTGECSSRECPQTHRVESAPRVSAGLYDGGLLESEGLNPFERIRVLGDIDLAEFNFTLDQETLRRTAGLTVGLGIQSDHEDLSRDENDPGSANESGSLN